MDYYCVECAFKHASVAFVLQRYSDLGYIPTTANLIGTAEILAHEMCAEEYQNLDHLIRLIGCLGAVPGQQARDARKFYMDRAVLGSWWRYEDPRPAIFEGADAPCESRLITPHRICMNDHMLSELSDVCQATCEGAAAAFAELTKEGSDEKGGF